MRLAFATLSDVLSATAAASAALGQQMRESPGQLDPDKLAEVLRLQQEMADALDRCVVDAQSTPAELEVLADGTHAFANLYIGYRLQMAKTGGEARPFARLLAEVQQAAREGRL